MLQVNENTNSFCTNMNNICKVSHDQVIIKFQRKSYNRNWPEVNHAHQLMRELLVGGGSHIVELVESPLGAMDHNVEIMKMLQKVHLLGNIHAHSNKGSRKSCWVARRLVQTQAQVLT